MPTKYGYVNRDGARDDSGVGMSLKCSHCGKKHVFKATPAEYNKWAGGADDMESFGRHMDSNMREIAKDGMCVSCKEANLDKSLYKNKRGPLKHKPAKVGYKDAASARETVSKLNSMPRSEARILANTLSNRAKFHQNQTEDMREAKSTIDAWRKKQRDKDEQESLEKSCPRCGKTSANKSNPSGRCRSCLKKLKANKHKPGHYLRAHMKADDALRRQDGKNGTAHHKSNGRGSRDSIVKQVKRAERKTGHKLSPDRKNNGKGYAASNTRMVPEHLNRGRHKVDGKKLTNWRKRLKKTDTSYAEFYESLLSKAMERQDERALTLLRGFDGDNIELLIQTIASDD